MQCLLTSLNSRSKICFLTPRGHFRSFLDFEKILKMARAGYHSTSFDTLNRLKKVWWPFQGQIIWPKKIIRGHFSDLKIKYGNRSKRISFNHVWLAESLKIGLITFEVKKIIWPRKVIWVRLLEKGSLSVYRWFFGLRNHVVATDFEKKLFWPHRLGAQPSPPQKGCLPEIVISSPSVMVSHNLSATEVRYQSLWPIYVIWLRFWLTLIGL